MPSPVLYRAFLWALVVGFSPGLVAQGSRYRPPADFAAGGKADQAEGAKILSGFRSAGPAGDYWLAFELRVLPREGPERSLTGQLLGSRNRLGPVTRLTLPGEGGLATEERWLIQSGPAPSAAHWSGATGTTTTLTPADAFTPIAGTDLTLFDLQMPFLYWPDFIYEGVARVRGRPASSFVLYPPPDVVAVRPQLTGVRVLLDVEFQALEQASLLGPKGETEKTITILDLKKVDAQWMVKAIDLRNHATRDKTRFTVTAAATNLALPAGTFAAAALAAAAPPVPAAKIERY